MQNYVESLLSQKFQIVFQLFESNIFKGIKYSVYRQNFNYFLHVKRV